MVLNISLCKLAWSIMLNHLKKFISAKVINIMVFETLSFSHFIFMFLISSYLIFKLITSYNNKTIKCDSTVLPASTLAC